MENKQYDLLIFITRASPFHLGHQRVVKLACEQARHVLILVGSSFQPRTIKNPFTYQERHDMIVNSLDPQEISKIIIRPIRDYLYSDATWIAQVQNHVDLLQKKISFDGHTDSFKTVVNIGIIGYEKDDSSYYLKEFPQWTFIDVGRNYDLTIDATTIRNMWLGGQSPRFAKGVLHDSVHKFVFEQFPKKEFQRLAEELRVTTDYKKPYEHLEHPPIFVTVDAVVVQSGHVLMVKRKAAPGQNLWALPGGYVNAFERIVDALFRELDEETMIKVPARALRKTITNSHVFDAPNRDLRGRLITHAFLLELEPGPLPKVKGSDDAAKAKWISFAELDKMEELIYADHAHIINYFLGKIKQGNNAYS